MNERTNEQRERKRERKREIHVSVGGRMQIPTTVNLAGQEVTRGINHPGHSADPKREPGPPTPSLVPSVFMRQNRHISDATLNIKAQRGAREYAFPPRLSLRVDGILLLGKESRNL